MTATDESARPRARKHIARAELRLARPSHFALRDVPLNPDPLAAFAAAVADVRPELGEEAQITIDLLPLTPARARHHRKAPARAVQQDAGPQPFGTLLASQLRQGLAATKGVGAVSPPPAPRTPAPSPPRFGRAKNPGKFTADDALFSAQILIRTTSEIPGRAQAHLKKILSAFNVFDGENYWRVVGRNFGPWHLGSDARTRRRGFDRRFETGLFNPAGESVVTGREIAGLLKPPTKHCYAANVERSGGLVPPAPPELPTYQLGASDLLPLGYVTTPDGDERFVGTPLAETLFSLILGKAGYGKTELMLTQMIALANAGHGTWFLDPHRDATRRALPYLAAEHVAGRVIDVDLTVRKPQEMICSWNPFDMQGRHRYDIPDVVGSITAAFASALGWDETSNRALTILTKACEALADLSWKLAHSGRPDLAPTIFQISTLLTDDAWREQVAARLDPVYQRFWFHTFEHYPKDAIPVVTNAIERISTSNTARAFLGGPCSTYDVRRAMDEGQVVLISPAGLGPTDRLVNCLLIFDLFRAGLSRRDLKPDERKEFHAFIDELTTVDGASKGTLAAIVEQLRKFRVKLFAATQMAARLTNTTRDALMQNRSVLSTTASEAEAARLVAKQWSGDVDPETIMMLQRYHHILSATIGGATTTPFKVRGAEVTELFAPWYAPEGVEALQERIHTNLGRRRLGEILEEQAGLDERIRAYLERIPPTEYAVQAGFGRRRGKGGKGGSASRAEGSVGRASGAQGSEVGHGGAAAPRDSVEAEAVQDVPGGGSAAGDGGSAVG